MTQPEAALNSFMSERYAVALLSLLLSWSVGFAASDAAAHLGAGLKLFDLQRFDEAAKEFQLALEGDPGLRDARYHLAVCNFNQRHYPEAHEQFEGLALIGYEKRWVTYYLARLDLIAGQWDSAIQRFQSLGGPDPLQDELYYLGSAFLKRGEPQKAVAPLAREIQINPRDFRAHDLLARAYMKTGRPKDAEREFETAEKLREYYRQGKTQLMDCHARLQAGESESAWNICGPILESDDIDLLVYAGMLFGQVGQHERALKFFHRAFELDPESPEVNYDTGLTLFWKKDYAAARTYLQSALAERPDFFEALATEGAILYLSREDAAARTVLQKAHALRPEDTAVNKLLSQLATGR